jgi:DNA-binding MarR family transcriptional regulator
LLWLVGEYPGIAQADVAPLLLVDRATMLGITNGLTKRALIERHQPASGGRRVGLHLTGQGCAMLEEAKRAVARHEKWLKKRFSPAELRSMTELLKRIYR